jgi:tetratricopeptide (TPR) repeat protein
MADLDLEAAIQQYAVALEVLTPPTPPKPDPKPDPARPLEPAIAQVTAAQVLAVLIARDRLQIALNNLTTTDAPPIPGENLEKLSQLDQSLRDQAVAIAPFTGSAEWRASFNPDPNAWWWFLESPKTGWSDRLDWLWNAVSITCLTISLGLLGDISPRFLTGGPDSFGAFTVSAQSVLTLLAAGSILTKAGQEALKRGLKVTHISEKYWHELGAAGAFLLMLGFFSMRQSLPQIATNFYTNPGVENREKGDWSSAEEQFKRAIKLNADDAQAHFQLGNLYEDLQMLDQARPEYQLAIQGGIPAATNNLARLNILKKDYPVAVSLLLKALELDKKQPLDIKTKHAVLKNLGWARLMQRNYPDAEKWLLEAIDLHTTASFKRDEIADPHCLLAQVIEAPDEKKQITPAARKKALGDWKLCNENANRTIPEQDAWIAIAQQRLAQSGN